MASVVLNLKGRKSLWRWLREVDPRNMFLLRALKRTQRMMSPEHHTSEYDLAQSRTAWRTAAHGRRGERTG